MWLDLESANQLHTPKNTRKTVESNSIALDKYRRGLCIQGQPKPPLPTGAACLASKTGNATPGAIRCTNIEWPNVTGSKAAMASVDTVGGRARCHNEGGQQVDITSEMELLWPIHPLPPPGERRRRSLKRRTGWWEGWQLNTTASLPSSPISTMPARTSHTWREVGEVEEDKDRLNTMKPQHRKTTFQTRTPPPKKLTINSDIWCVCLSGDLVASFCLEVRVYLVRGFSAEVTERVLNYWAVAASREGRHTEAEEGTLICRYMLSANTHTKTPISPEECVFFLADKMLLSERFFYMLKHTEAEILLNSVDLWMSLTFIWRKKDDSGKEEITDVYFEAKHSGCLTGKSPIHPFSRCVLLSGSTPQSLPDSPLAARKTNLTTGDKLPERSEDFSAESSSALFSAALVFSSRIWPPVCFPLSAWLDMKEGLKC